YRLRIAGLIPFLSLSVLCLSLSGELQQQAGQALVAYGAVIAAFLGAWHWGAAIDAENREAVTARMLFAVTPALLGWLAILLPLFYGLVLVMATLLFAWFADRRLIKGHAWYLVLRKRLTFVATLSLAVAALVVLQEV
ncbi:MAG TPA: DUF3429 domain-containing protein, partial [Gammaproteobacteria bacterium]|nr:DUF3429 domain-containing protein [Gammaproteobacteria bacterium]